MRRRAKPPSYVPDANNNVAVSPPEDLHFTAARRSLDLSDGYAAPASSGIGFTIASFFLVLLQLTTAWSLFSTMGNQYGVCSSSLDCGRAMWCTVARHRKSAINGMCLSCGKRDGFGSDPMPQFCAPDGSVLPSATAEAMQALLEASDPISGVSQRIYTELTMYDVSAFCSGCTDVRGYLPRAAAMNIGSIGVREGVMFVLVAVTASLSVMEEALALGKTLLYIHRAPVPAATTTTGLWRLWRTKRILLLCLQQVRIFMLASVVTMVPLFVIFDSADGVSILLNTVAALLILELDNFAFAFGVRELERSELLQPFSVPLHDATNAERTKEMVACSSLLGICLVGLGAEMEGTYLIIPWALVLLASTLGECLLVCRGGGYCPWTVNLLRLLLVVALTFAYPLHFGSGTWWMAR